jgi:two-component system nitrate/nitrite response regulator NarL
MKMLIADDHELFGELLKTIVEKEGLAESVETHNTFDKAYAAVMQAKADKAANYDLILLDMRMPGMNGLSGLRRMIDLVGTTPVAIISGMLSPAEAREVMQEGAAGFLAKTMASDDLRDALKTLLQGGRYVAPFLMVGRQSDAITTRTGRLFDLTTRELQVLNELMRGWSNKQISENLGIAEITVKSHLMHLFRKIGAKNRTDAVRLAVRLKAEAAGTTDALA